MKSYKTVKENSVGELVEKKSKFIGYVAPVSTEDEALMFLNEIRKKHWDATHNVYAYSIASTNTSRCSDDGEPAKTAGAPILDVIEKNGLSNIIIVVTRYFGGTLLGTGGLVKAYSESAKIALSNAKIVTMTNAVEFVFSVSYSLLSKFENEFTKCDIEILEKEFTEEVNIRAICRECDFKKISDNFYNLCNGQTDIIKVKETFYGF